MELVRAQHRDALPAALTAGRDRRRAEAVALCEHLDRRLVEPEVVDRVRDRAVLDQEHAVAGEPGGEQRLRFERTQVPEPRDQHAALDALDELVARGVAALEHPSRCGTTTAAATTTEAIHSTGRLLALLLGPVPRVRQPGEDALVDPSGRREREALGVER